MKFLLFSFLDLTYIFQNSKILLLNDNISYVMDKYLFYMCQYDPIIG